MNFEDRVIDYLIRLDEKVDRLFVTEERTNGRLNSLEKDVEDIGPTLHRHSRALAAILLILAVFAGANPAVAAILKGVTSGI